MELLAIGWLKDFNVKQPEKQSHLINQITRSIKTQVNEFNQHLIATLAPITSGEGNDGVDDGSRDLPELRIMIELDITIGSFCLVDKFEWDIACKRNNPEEFAELLVLELNLVPGI